jgi:hypothetical protein
MPASDQWIRKMAATYRNEGIEIVLGFSPYTVKSSLINLFIQFDTFYTALQYFSFALAGMPYMGVGRNLSYRRSLFFQAKGFAPFLKVASGDDDLFVNHNATVTNVAIQLDPETFMVSKPKKTWAGWVRQKTRHLRTGKYYKGRHKTWLSIIWLSNILFYTAVALTCIFVKPFWLGLVVLGLRMIFQVIIMAVSLRKLGMTGLWYLTPVLDLLYQLVYYPIFGLLGMFVKKRRAW